MLCNAHIERVLSKTERFEEMLNPYLFDKVESIDIRAFVADKQYHTVPDDSLFEAIGNGWHWGGEGNYCWFKGEYTVPDHLDGKDIFIMPKVGGYEAMLWVDGVPFGTFNTKIVYTSHGNHYCGLIKKNAKAGETISIAVEYYAGHDYHGCDPFSDQHNPYSFYFESFDICTKNEKINKFYFDLKTVNQLAKILPDDSLMKAYAQNALIDVHKIVYYSPEDVDKDTFFDAIDKAQPVLDKVLSKKGGEEGLEVGIIGHSHMDTAWLWHIGETIKKCARTYGNQISLMEQYPEHRFVQSSSCHSDMIRKYYPALFERIKEKVAQGRYEPNGAVWVECDCNITSGESMVRQFLWGQRFTQKHFGYKSDCFWLPDTFGYSAAIPQIMKGCGVDYFLTTKISWNDTNTFPYDTFYWQGLDGTQVFSHFNMTHTWPDPKQLKEAFVCNRNNTHQNGVTNKRLSAYGMGDGGGGPQFEMIEMARRCENLYDVPRAKHTTVSDFMKDLEATAHNPNTYKGELYLELHRGTLTNQHEIKYNNRKAEQALHDLEYLTVSKAVENDAPCTTEESNKLYETLLINQFHDILPGTCINSAHTQSKAEMTALIAKAKEEIKGLACADGNSISVTNTLSFDRGDVIFAPDNNNEIAGVKQQCYTNLNGEKVRLIGGVRVPAFSTVALKYGEKIADNKSPFAYDGKHLETPFAKMEFDENGFISSFIDTTANRQLVEGLALNTFVMAEDVPSSWDNWDVDPDIELKFNPCATLIERKVVSDGEVAFIIRSKYKISEKSTVTQDMICFADSAEVRFDTLMDWQDNHRFLKTAFDTNVKEDFARHEIQFGYCKRPTTRNNSLEQAKFEVVNHKYTDLSETGYGVAILNDCKYGISVNGSQMRLSLHKGGTRPDVKGDRGLHRAVYSFLPHNCGFNSKAVIHPAYQMNMAHVVAQGDYNAKSLVNINMPNVIAEAIKPCEDGEKAYIVRLYEAEGTRTNCEITFNGKGFAPTNMLEEELEKTQNSNTLQTTFAPFEIKTYKVYY